MTQSESFALAGPDGVIDIGDALFRAEELRRADALDAAEALFHAVLQHRPGNVAANLGLGRCDWARGALDQALQRFAAATGTGEHIWPLLQFGQGLRKDGNLAMAERAYQAAADLMPDRPEPLAGLAHCARQRGAFEQAAAFQRAACELAPDDEAAKLDLARDLRQLDRLEEAQAIVAGVLARAPNLPSAQKLAAAIARGSRRSAVGARTAPGRDAATAPGSSETMPEPADGTDAGQMLHEAEELRLRNDIDGAAALFDAVLATKPANINAHLGAARCAAMRGDNARALIHFTKAARRSAKIGPLAQFAAACLKGQDTETAAAAWREAADIAPDSAAPWLGLAACARRNGDLTEAVQFQRDACTRAPEDLDAQLDLARDLRNLQLLDDATRIVDDVLAREPDHTAALRLAATLARRRGDSQRVADLQERLLAADPADAEARGPLAQLRPLLQLAADCRKAGRLDLAEAGYRRAADLQPERPEPWLGLAACARCQGDFAEAASFQRTACRHAPTDLRARTDLARDLRALGDHAGADAELDAVLAQDPAFAPALRLAAARARAAGDEDAAESLLQRARAAAPKVATLVKRIQDLRERGETQEALELADAAVQAEPGNVAALVQLGLLHRENDAPKDAIAAFRRAHECAPEDVTVILHLVRELRADGQPDAAAALLNQALELDRTGTRALAQHAEQMMLDGNPSAALASFEAAIARAPAQASLYAGAANALARLGRVSDALGVLDQADLHCDPSPLLAMRRVQLLRQLGRMDAARDCAERAREAFADHLPLWESTIGLRLDGATRAEAEALFAAAEAAAEDDAARASIAALRGDHAMDRGDAAEAVACYQQAVALDPADQSARGNLARAHLACFALDAASEDLQQLSLMRESAARRRLRSHAAKGFLDTVLNEYRIDAQAQAALTALPDAPAARVPRLLELCRAFPDNTLLAASLVDALWRSGLLTNYGTSGAPRIPRRIVQFWNEPAPPPDVAELMASWQDGVPDGAYRVYDTNAARRFLTQHFGTEEVFAFHRGITLSVRADHFRLAALAAEGGIYADAFDRRIGSIDDLLPPSADLVLYRGELGLLSNGFMAAAPGHPVLRTALDDATLIINRGDKDLLWLSTGPGLITRSFARYLAEDPRTLVDRLARVVVWSRQQIQRSLAVHCLAEWKATLQPRSPAYTQRTYSLRASEAA